MLLCAMFTIRLFLDKYDKINIFVLDSHCNLMLKATKTDSTNESPSQVSLRFKQIIVQSTLTISLFTCIC